MELLFWSALLGLVFAVVNININITHNLHELCSGWEKKIYLDRFLGGCQEWEMHFFPLRISKPIIAWYDCMIVISFVIEVEQ